MMQREIQPAEVAPQYLSFQLLDGTYALEIESILEIRAIGTATPLPGAPPYVRGIMNLRGALVPVIDLRVRLGLPKPAALTRFAVTIITKVQNKIVGLVADGVNEVLSIPKSSLQTPASLLDHGDRRFIQALALISTNGDSHTERGDATSMVALLNLDRLYDAELDAATGLTSQGDAGSLITLHHSVADRTPNAHPSLTETHA